MPGGHSLAPQALQLACAGLWAPSKASSCCIATELGVPGRAHSGDPVPPLCSRAGNEQEPTLGFASARGTKSEPRGTLSLFAVPLAAQGLRHGLGFT